MASSTTSAPLLMDLHRPKARDNDEEAQDSNDSHTRLSLSEVFVELKMLFTVAFPMIVTGLFNYFKAYMSMLFLGRLGKDALAGGALAIGIANITGYSVISGLALGMEAICSQAFGANQWSLMGQTLQRTVIILLFACIPISILWLNIQPILVLLAQDPTISSIAAAYLTVCLPDLLFQSFINPLKIFLRSQNITAPLMISAGIAVVLHAPINYFFTCYLALGIQGSAFALSLTNFILLAILLGYSWHYGNQRRSWHGSIISWTLLGPSCFDHDTKTILKLALPNCLSVCLEWWYYEIMILLSGILSNAPEAVATMGILIQATSLVYIFPHSLSSAASTRVGIHLGANQPGKARASSYIALVCAVLTSLIAMSFMVTLGRIWGRAFTHDEAILALTAAVMPVVGLCELGNCPQTTGCGVLRGSARPTLGARINLWSFYVVGVPMAMIFGFGMKLGLLGLWWGLLVAQAVCASVMIWALSKTDWALQVRWARDLIGGNGEKIDHQEVEVEEEEITPIKTLT